MSQNFYDPLVECHYCHNESLESSCKQEEIEVEVMRSGDSSTFHISKKSGFTGMSINSGRKFFKKKEVYVCDSCRKLKIEADNIDGGWNLLFYWYLFIVLVVLVPLNYFGITVPTFVFILLMMAWPTWLLLKGSAKILMTDNRFLSKRSAHLGLVGSVVLGLFTAVTSYKIVFDEPMQPTIKHEVSVVVPEVTVDPNEVIDGIHTRKQYEEWGNK